MVTRLRAGAAIGAFVLGYCVVIYLAYRDNQQFARCVESYSLESCK